MGYMQELRALVGSRPLIAVGADALVRRGESEVLLQLRRDGRYWSLPGGALEPGESLEDAARRELQEETGLVARDQRLLTVCSGPQYDHIYPNGDRIHNVVAIYLALGVDGELCPDPEEGLKVRYFSTGALPEMPASSRRMLARALEALRQSHWPRSRLESFRQLRKREAGSTKYGSPWPDPSRAARP